jgi:hypothetical protein
LNVKQIFKQNTAVSWTETGSRKAVKRCRWSPQKGIGNREQWMLHTQRIPNERIPKKIMKQQPRGTDPFAATDKRFEAGTGLV